MRKKIYLIAGEASGDKLGSTVVEAIKQLYPDAVIKGIAGTEMLKAGMSKSLFPIQDLSVMGISEVLRTLPRILWRMRQTIKDIKSFEPDVLLTIDAPDFSFRIHKAIRKSARFKVSQQHLVAPSVWAWRPDRARKCAQFLDKIYCLLPFEPPYFEQHGLKAVFCGHPLATNLHPVKRDNAVLARLGIRGGPIVALLFGSRNGEFERMGAQIVEAAQLLTLSYPNISFVIPTLPAVEDKARSLAMQIPAPSHILTAYEDKHQAMASCDAAIAVSGTIGLELSMLQIPHLITYRFSGISAWFAKRFVKTKYVHLGNIVLQKPVVPELLQHECRAEMLATVLTDILSDEATQQAQRDAFVEVREKLLPADPDGAGHLIARAMFEKP